MWVFVSCSVHAYSILLNPIFLPYLYLLFQNKCSYVMETISLICMESFNSRKHQKKKLLNKNWVTVTWQMPPNNVQFKWHTFLKKKKNPNRQTDGRTHKRTDGRTVRLYYAPNFIWGHKKSTIYWDNPSMFPFYLLTGFISWLLQIMPYEMVKYRKGVENLWSYVLKRTTPIVGARHSQHVFTDDYSRH